MPVSRTSGYSVRVPDTPFVDLRLSSTHVLLRDVGDLDAGLELTRKSESTASSRGVLGLRAVLGLRGGDGGR